jgi:hypothetical protein
MLKQDLHLLGILQQRLSCPVIDSLARLVLQMGECVKIARPEARAAAVAMADELAGVNGKKRIRQ